MPSRIAGVTLDRWKSCDMRIFRYRENSYHAIYAAGRITAMVC